MRLYEFVCAYLSIEYEQFQIDDVKWTHIEDEEEKCLSLLRRSRRGGEGEERTMTTMEKTREKKGKIYTVCWGILFVKVNKYLFFEKEWRDVDDDDDDDEALKSVLSLLSKCKSIDRWSPTSTRIKKGPNDSHTTTIHHRHIGETNTKREREGEVD